MFTLPWKRRAGDAGGRVVARAAPSLPAGAGRVECQVVDPVGVPMRAAVCVLDGSGQQLVDGGTDVYGVFTAAVAPGDYQLAISCEGFQPHRADVRAVEGTRVSAGVVQLGAAPVSPAPAPGRWEIDPAHTAVRFVARHIGLAEIHGRFNRFSGSLWVAERMRDSQVEVYIEADSIDTGVPMRDDHLRSPDFLDAAVYPYLRFTGSQFVHRGGSQWSVTGVLELHGVSRTV
jgi:polyisoprenoid-binding protein YceI